MSVSENLTNNKIMQTFINYIVSLFQSGIALIHSLASLIGGSEPMIKGLVTIAIISSVALIGKKLPRQIFYFLLKTISITVVYKKPSEEHGMLLEIIAYDNFTSKLAELSKTKFFTLDRKVEAEFGKVLTEKISFGVGNIYGSFFFKGKFYIFNRIINKGDKNTPLADEVSLTVLLGEKEDILKILPKPIADNTRKFYSLARYDHSSGNECTILSDEYNIFLPKELKLKIDNAIEYFLENKEGMLSRGIPWKLTFLFYGPPGTGKTTLTSYIAKKLKKSIAAPADIYSTINLSKAARNNAVLALDDIDCQTWTRKRKPKIKVEDDENGVNSDMTGLSDFLNFLQGPCPLNGDVIVMTTNYLEKLEPAIYRSSRVDEIIFVDFYGLDDLKDWSKFFFRELYDESKFPNFDSNIRFRPADLAELYRRNSKDIVGFYNDLQERSESLIDLEKERLASIEMEKLFERAKVAKAHAEINNVK